MTASTTRVRLDPDARRAELADAAIRVIRSIGADASMADIAAEAGISKPVLYHHFGDKAGLAAAIADRFLVDLGHSLDGIFTNADDPRAAVAEAIEVFVVFAEREPALHRFLVEGSQGTGRGAGELPVLPALAAQWPPSSSPGSVCRARRRSSSCARSPSWAPSSRASAGGSTTAPSPATS